MGDRNLEYRLSSDIGPAAKTNPDITFIVYHSGFDPDMTELRSTDSDNRAYLLRLRKPF